jgi:hypothetical protein
MARIRSIKPAFFRHEKLQDIESNHPGSYVMLTYAGLWTLCDNQGAFEYKPRLIKLDVLPFIDFDMTKTLGILKENGLIQTYEAEGKLWGFVPTFREHQRITGKEAADGQRCPDIPVSAPGNPVPSGETPERSPENNETAPEEQPRNTGETSGKHPGINGDKPVAQELEREWEEEWEGEKELDAQALENPPPPIEPATPSYRRPHGLPLGAERIAELIQVWNSHDTLPECRNPITMTWPNIGAISNNLAAWSQPEIVEAIGLYAQAYASPGDYDSGTCCWPDLQSFLAGKGLNRFNAKARPLEVYARRTKQSESDRVLAEYAARGRS